MPTYLFPAFKEDAPVSEQVGSYWQIQGARAGSWKSPWMHNPRRDGNPVFTAVYTVLNRGVRIIQEETPATDETDFDCWINTFGDKNDSDAIQELVIACCPSVENEQKVETTLRRWVLQGDLAGDGSASESWPSVPFSEPSTRRPL